ncbi:MAG: DUF2309 domain-containing protein [Kofleriaceae bacterium]
MTVADAVARACARIAPTWPLDRSIAVNPWWGSIESPIVDVATRLRALSGAQLLMPRAWYRQAYRDGHLRDVHLQAALAASGAPVTLAELIALLDRPEPPVATRARVVDVVDAGQPPAYPESCRAVITDLVSQCCAALFDDGQAQVGPDRDGGLYPSWRRLAARDRSFTLRTGVALDRLRPDALPATAPGLIDAALTALEVAPGDQETYLWSLLLDQNGWASWCAYRRWVARLAGDDDAAIEDLLAIRLAWEWMLLGNGGAAVARRWQLAMAAWPQLDAAAALARPHDWLFQAALELGWREPVLRGLPAGLAVARDAAPSAQAVFCIDVRSEVFRRGLEAVAPSVQTLGFAGFFGLPLDYVPVGATAGRPQLPGLLAPRLRAADAGVEAAAVGRRRGYLERAAAWAAFKRDPLSTFTHVEALGLAALAPLVADSLGLGPRPSEDAAGLGSARLRPRLASAVTGAPVELDARCELAAAMLRGMSLTRGFAPVVLLVGHGSTTANNPHAAGLDCGACGGQRGEVNARVAAALLNEPEVRAGLATRGIMVPSATWFVAALHDTTTDDVTLFDLDELPPSHCDAVDALRGWLADAGAQARAERARRLGLDEATPGNRDRAVRARATDWAQVRPEWGLANNAALIVAPREHCRHLDLAGRAFLHEYRHREDAGYAVLEQIMTAPMVVAHWINFQYYASTVDNLRYGSGTKVLHDVVGGHLGVFEGNGGDLRIGLPLQSLHDGTRWVHTPLRLCVVIEAPRAAIDGVLARHAHVRALVTNGWLALCQLDDEAGEVYAWRAGGWDRVTPAGASAAPPAVGPRPSTSTGHAPIGPRAPSRLGETPARC